MTRKNLGMISFLLSIALFSLGSQLHAGTPLWSFTALTPTTVSVPGNGSATIRYTVRNNSSKPHTLRMTPITGITQTTTGVGVCGNPFTLPTKGSSCTLSLQVSGSQLTGPITDGPIICEQGSALQCYRPSYADYLNISTATNQYTVGGIITGLTGTVTLLNNGTNELITSTDGLFTFTTPLVDGSAYAVTVQSDPLDQTCTVNNATGSINGTNVTNVSVTCSTDTYTVGGTVSGLSGTGTVVLQNNGTDPQTIDSAQGSFTFSTAIAQGSTYAVTVQTQPETQTCTVSNGTGTMGGSNVTNVSVTCSTNTYTVGGAVSGLSGTVILLNNASNSTSVNANGNFTFSTPVAQGSAYEVTVGTQPSGQTCTVSNGSGTMGGANVTNVGVVCASNNTTISVSAQGTIPVTLGRTTSSSFTVTNTGSAIAQNVSITLPSGWTAVNQDISACITIAVSGSCNINLTSTAAYVAEGGIVVTGDNITSPPTTALATTVDGYLVWAVSGTTSQVIATSDEAAEVWGDFTTVSATSLTDGAGNTAAIDVSAGGAPSAGKNCFESTLGGAPTGTWYLPAICQMGSSGGNASCTTGLANIRTNLTALGFGSFAGGFYLSSTQNVTNLPYIWAFIFSSNNQATPYSNTFATIYRCARSITPS